ncbi:MAG: zinc ABC transporter substrate-binding protein [Myxococcales bacterium]|nr:zinc ABC transporter substrate-binding protein [Myxococcales bacterium]
MKIARIGIFSMLLAVLGTAIPGAARGADKVQVCATVPELGDLVREVGGDAVDVTVFAKPGEDPHFVIAKPSYIRRLADADLLILVGLDLEIGWLPTLIGQSRNPRIVRGTPGYVDGGSVVTPLEVPTVVDRAMGDVHPQGNPHYLLDPLEGLKVAALIRDRLSTVDPTHASVYANGYDAFRRRMGERLVGPALAAKYDFEKLALLAEHGRLEGFLTSQGDRAKLAGWLGEMTPFHGAKVVVDHMLWPYFSRRFDIEVVGAIEPKPRVPPSTSHLADLIDRMKAQGVRAILSAPYFDPASARLLAEHTGAAVVPMAHQAGSRPGTDGYLDMVDYNVRALTHALGAAKEGKSDEG